ncbi:sigma-54-dependent Fis family transcriptional regulator [Telmatocola sphagniphila]|uniref:DNA-binding transcriptional regulator NtrC n=1 Tax=Telmatocola sphagniphila TaxID=1123043 RepID=A0A8E6B4S3_9BACT|nr:sigma-54 dependent transcriptional regulator [Telmatocola sphagniphila]QVL30380.1 sigma-54-dependent Fis family transcriptional regulator [Telmatocola sphagniphila]
MKRLIVIDDDPLVIKCFHYAFPPDEFEVREALTGAEGLYTFNEDRPDVVISDVRLPDMSGLDLVEKFKAIDSRIPIILMTGHGTAETAIMAMRQGAFDYIMKPIDPDQLLECVNKACEISRLMRVPARLPDPEIEYDSTGETIIGRSSAMQEVYKTIGRVASTNVSVLILGENGTGKELVARAIYHYSKRSDKPFMAVNCAAIPETLLESELFGHEKGSFTGADRRRIGKFEQSSGGTIFLDEIGDMTPLTQAKVLRVLQDQQFERVGGNETIRADVRLITATNRNLDDMITHEKFREDLLYRINVCTIRLPPLRERREDIPLLVHYFIRRYESELEKKITGVEPQVIQLLTDYPWPGNIRQLQNVIKQALLRTVGPNLLPEFLPDEIAEVRGPATPESGVTKSGSWTGMLRGFIKKRLEEGGTELHQEMLALLETELIAEVIRFTKGNLSQSAAILGITRPTLRAKLEKLGIDITSNCEVNT